MYQPNLANRTLATAQRGVILVIALVVLVAMTLAAVGLARPAAATTFDVTTTEDVADAQPGDGKCASAQNACSLRAAIQEADKSSFAITITLPAGTFALKSAGPDDAQAATGDLDVLGDVTITGAGKDGTIIDGGGVQRVFHVAENANVKISDQIPAS